MTRTAIPALAAFALLGLAPAARADEPSSEAQRPVYELRTYHTAPGKLDALNARFRDHTVALFQKHGMTNVGYWTPLDDKDGKGSTLVYLLRHASRDAAKKSWADFGSDPEWKSAREESEKNGKLVDKVESVYLEPTDYSPNPMKASAASVGNGRVFELRTYVASEGRLDKLNKRFREHTIDLFRKHGLESIGYWTPLDDKDGKGKSLVYLLAAPSREKAEASWKAFRDDPEWKQVKSASESDGVPLAAKVTSVFLAPTDYSALK